MGKMRVAVPAKGEVKTQVWKWDYVRMQRYTVAVCDFLFGGDAARSNGLPVTAWNTGCGCWYCTVQYGTSYGLVSARARPHRYSTFWLRTVVPSRPFGQPGLDVPVLVSVLVPVLVLELLDWMDSANRLPYCTCVCVLQHSRY